MVIDTHVRPALYAPICTDQAHTAKRCDEMNYHLMGPTDLALLKKQYALADIAHAFLLPSDCRAETKTPAISNDEIAQLVRCEPELFWGFATVDPRCSDASEELERAFSQLNLRGLYLNTARLHLYPTDERCTPLYALCQRYHKPIIFHAGLCLEQNALAMYARPADFEEVVYRYPELNICLAHVGWPWVQETAALLIKYPNLYTNTALMSFDGPQQLYHKVFQEDMGTYWLEHNIADKVMFGSDTPRIRPVRSKRGLDSLGLSTETLEKIYYKNALRFLKKEE